MTRPSLDYTYMTMAEAMSLRATCSRRKVGAVVVDVRGYVLSTGYNGQARGFVHCIDKPCPGAGCPSGTGLELCQAIHAEANALIRLKEPFEADTMYVTTAPCIHCAKLALATGIKRVVFKDDYPNSGKEIWELAGRTWEKL